MKMIEINSVKQYFIKTLTKSQEDEVFTRSAALAFYSVFAIVPIVYLLTYSLSYMSFSNEMNLLSKIDDILSPEASHTLSIIIDNIKSKSFENPQNNIISIFILFITSSVTFSELQTTLNKIFRSKELIDEDEGALKGFLLFLKRKSLAIVMVLFFILFAATSLVISTFVNAIAHDGIITIVRFTNTGLNFMVFIFMFALIFKLLPDRKVKYKHAFIGGLITSVLFIIGKSIISWYLSTSTNYDALGATASLAIFLSWVYYTTLIIFIGAEFSYQSFIKEKDSV